MKEILINGAVPILENIAMYLIFVVGIFSSAKFIKEEDHYFNNRKKYIWLSLVLFILISCIEINSYLRFLLFCLVNGILFHQVFGESIKRIICFNLYVIVLYSLISFPLSLIKGLNSLIVKFIVLIILFVLDKFIYKFNFNLDSLKEVGKRNVLICVLGYTLIFLIVGISIYIFCMKSENISYICNLVFTGLLIIFINLSLIRTYKLNKSLSYIESLETDKRILTKENDKIRIFKHDFNNIIQAMNGYIQTEDIPSLKTFVKKMIKDVNDTEEINIGNKFLLNNKAITNLLNRKAVKAKKENIDINFEVMFDLHLLKKYEYDLVRILGIFLDNAIEAEREEENKKIEVLFLRDGDCKFIKIENSCTKEIDLDKIYTKEFSTKKGNTGLGLWEVRNLVNSNPNFSLETTLENNSFKHMLKIV